MKIEMEKIKNKIPIPIKNFFTKDAKMKLLVAYLVANLICILAGSYIFVSGNIKPNFSYNNLALWERKLLEYNVIVFLVIVFEKKYKKDWSHLGILLITIFAFISAHFAINKSMALDGALRRYEGLYAILYYLSVMLLSTFVSNKYKKALAVTVLLCGIIQVSYAICQSFNLFNVKIFYHYKNLLITGLTNNPNFLGTYMLLCLSYSIGLFIDSKNIVKSILYAICIALFMCGLLISNATSCAVGLFFVMIYVLIFCLKKEHYIKIIAIFAILIFITCLIAKLGKTTLLNDFGTLKDETTEIAKGNFDDYYGTKRIYIWKETLKIVPKYLLHGVGIDNFTNAFDGRALTFRAGNRTIMYDKVHNEYLQTLVTQGIFSIICYVALYTYVVIKGVKYSFKQNQIYLILPVIGYIIQAFFNISVIEVAPIFFMALGLCINKK
ncbi:MAG: O-antigen ligase family protein [Clostridia bacterium]|nr:O-antigen ligase family protein [Clostridia bacterium]